MKKKLILILACFMAVSLIFAACGAPQEDQPAPAPSSSAPAPAPSSDAPAPSSDAPAPSSDSQYEEGVRTSTGCNWTVGLTSADLTVPAYTSISNFLGEELDALNIDYTFVSASSDPAKQVTQMENFMQSKTGAIIIMEACDQETMHTVVQQCNEAGSYVIGYGMIIEKAVMQLACPNLDIGAELGEMVWQWMEANYPGEKVEWAGLHHTLVTSGGGTDRWYGTVDGIAAGPNPDNYVMVADQVGDTTEEGMSLTESMVQANPNIKVIVSTSGGGGLGANEAFKSLGYTDQTKYAVFGVDATTDILQMLVDGSQPFQGTICVGSDYYMATHLAQMCLQAFKGELPSEEDWCQYSVQQKVTVDNVKEYIVAEHVKGFDDLVG